MFTRRPRRHLQFTLRLLLALIVLAALGTWIGSEALRARRRAGERERLLTGLGAVVESATRLRADNGAIFGPLAPGPADPSRLRRWMGDEAVVEVVLPFGTSPDEVGRVKELFPEADVHVQMQPANPPTPGMF